MFGYLIIALLIIISTYIITSCSRHFRLRTFKGDKHVPGESPDWLIGNLRTMGVLRGVPIHRGYMENQKRYGDVWQFFMGPEHELILGHPDWAQHVLTKRNIYEGTTPNVRQTFSLLFKNGMINLQGATHRRHARVMLPMLKKARALEYVSTINDTADGMIDAWQTAHQQLQQQSKSTATSDGFTHNLILRHMQYLLLDMIGEIGYAESCGLVAKNVISELVTNMSADYVPKEIVSISDATTYLVERFTAVTLSGIPPFLAKYVVMADKRWKQSFKVLRAFIRQQIDKHDEAELTSARDQVNILRRLVSVLARDVTSVSEDSNQLTEEEVMDELLLTIVAGYETTATILSWFVVVLSKNPDVQARIKAEIRKVAPPRADGTYPPIDEDMLNQLDYMDCVVKETLRWAPTASAFGRYAVTDDVIDGVHIPAGQVVSLPAYLFHMDPRFWKLDPTKYIPERFYGPDAPDRDHHPYAFMPFGGGHHGCAGQELARVELKVIMTRLMQRVTFHDTPENQIKEVQRITCVPGNISVRVTFDK